MSEQEPDLATTLAATGALLQRYVRFASQHQAVAVALWVAHTWILEAFDATPYLHVFSPEKRCGKTRLLELLELLVRKAWRPVLPSEAVLFRKIERDCPTLLLDEVDTVFGRAAGDRYEGLRALLNAGHRRGATVPRCEGDGARMTLKDFSTFCPKALAGIGRLPDTVADRCIPIRLERRAAGEHVERGRRRARQAAAAPVTDALAAWSASDEAAALAEARPEIPEQLDDRAADGWEPLLAIADAAGGFWPAHAREAAVELHASEAGADESGGGVELLRDLRRLFYPTDEDGQPLAPLDELTSAEIEKALGKMEDRPWPEWHQGKPITKRQIANLLRRFRIRPGVLWPERDGVRTSARGYVRARFEDAFSRYLPATTPPEASQRHTPSAASGYGAEPFAPVTDRKSATSLSANASYALTDESAPEGSAELIEEGYL